jgi:predicted GNAT family N-acyltransferase
MTKASELSIKICLFTHESQAIRSIRETVFQEEQGISPELEWDGLDEQCLHLVAKLGSKSVGVGRLRELTADILKLERLAVLASYRQQGVGSEMVYTAIAYSKEQGYSQMTLNAQASIAEFYERLGFTKIGKPFTEACIEHIKMEQSLTKEDSEPQYTVLP